MSHLSPAVYLLWTCLLVIVATFLVFHLWNFDRFKCLKWSTQSGAFKRVMTYSYILTIPLLATFTIGYVVIKYKEGYMFVPGYGIIPTPYLFWKESSQKAIFPLTLSFACGWALEMVTHLEELCFWLFLVNAAQVGQDWFRSLYFKVWVGGSITAVIYMPVVAIATRADPLHSEASVVLAGSLGSLALTLWFTPILFTFPRFLEGLKREGVDMNTVVRLTKFHELNSIRVIFRYLFAVSFVILGLDGIQGKHHINESALWTDLLGFMAALGVCISTAITLVIFFPRNIQGEITGKDQRRTRHRGGLSTSSQIVSRAGNEQISTFQSTTSIAEHAYGAGGYGGANAAPSGGRQPYFVPQAPITEDDEDDFKSAAGDLTPYSPANTNKELLYSPGKDGPWDPPSYRASHRPSVFSGTTVTINAGPTPAGAIAAQYKAAATDGTSLAPPSAKSMPRFSPNRRLTEEEGGGVEMGAVAVDDAAARGRQGTVNLLIHNYTSPIDLMNASSRPRYTGSRV